MENKYCWRCKIEVPFLDEEEYLQAWEVYGECMNRIKSFRKENNAEINKTPIGNFFEPVRTTYEKITGYKNMHHNAVMHHRLSLLGPDCPSCGKPLRTSKAKLCPECGWKKEV
jgi:hypothetical protein